MYIDRSADGRRGLSLADVSVEPFVQIEVLLTDQSDKGVESLG